MPASTTAPPGPARTMVSIISSSDAPDDAAGGSELIIGLQSSGAEGNSFAGLALGEALEIDRHGVDVFVAQILQAVVDDLGHGAVDGPPARHPGAEQVRDILDAPIAEAGLLVRRQGGRVPVLHGDQAALEGLRL